MTTPHMTIDVPVAHGLAMQRLVLLLDQESKAGRRVEYSGGLSKLLRNVRVGRRGASMSVPDDVKELETLIGVARMLKISFRDHVDYARIIETHLTRALAEAKKSPLERLAAAADG